ncbi:Pollen_Ole_e_I domain-containing protein [Cephalotus follicularis]|uniref:Pollen_Ole_e_I domain-containing protein n=1 Tax=Cephalotus follicularis TaxID=3775 RepID=A0A1Q3D6J5_CEPFO|nr:Pollen_Ole_e_I domain-containing protein [Cephalotus follicularis]
MITFISFLLLLSLAFPSVVAHDNTTKPVEKHTDLVVEGMVYRQSCDHYRTWSLSDASAKLSVICKNQKNQVSYYKAFKTNDEGYFYAHLAGFKMTHYLSDHPLQSCHVKLVSSPLENCSSLSNVNEALNGAPLRYENKVLKGRNHEAVIYAAGPLAFSPSQCPTNHF